jgi:hypothetical protein
MCDKVRGVDNLSCTSNVQLILSTPQMLSEMHSLDDLLHGFNHKCTA